ncbi:Ikbke [Symbiodinium pilosum]|uniref:Ikbke protein n=1 Tax=Symbiodinium pilosum TaxID=2952 RepID=A0A812TWI0_SYMPI|nr:Ikbke [Symbiodinium pilosum]
MAPELARAYLKAGPGHAQHCPVVLTASMDLWSIAICVLETVFLSSALTDRYLQLKRRTGADMDFLTWLADMETDIIAPAMYDAVRSRSGALANFLCGMLRKDASKRLSAAECLKHKWFHHLHRKLQMTTGPVRRAQSVQHLPARSVQPTTTDAVHRSRSDTADPQPQAPIQIATDVQASTTCTVT